MPWRTRLRMLAELASDLITDADRYLAAVLDTRPLIDHLCTVAAYLGRTWRRARHRAMTAHYGPARTIAVTIRPRAPKDHR